jgi:hypothetical protein
MRRLLAVATFAVLLSCGDRIPTAPITPSGDAPADLLFSSKPKLVECEAAEFESRTVELGPAGGTISVGDASVLFPENALLDQTLVTLTIPASRYLEVEITTNGQTVFPYESLRPIVTIGYSRCNRSDVLFKVLSAWYIDSNSKDLLEMMTSFDNKLTRSVTFPAGHFSGYAIAF